MNACDSWLGCMVILYLCRRLLVRAPGNAQFQAVVGE
jgi:hypothetical protein